MLSALCCRLVEVVEKLCAFEDIVDMSSAILPQPIIAVVFI